jgi:hypothetical protein
MWVDWLGLGSMIIVLKFHIVGLYVVPNTALYILGEMTKDFGSDQVVFL